MTARAAFEEAAGVAVAQLGAGSVRTLAQAIENEWPEQAILQAVPMPSFADIARSILAARRSANLSPEVAASYLRGVAAGYTQQAAAVRVESVWSGPGTHPVPVRATGQVLAELVAEAIHELLLMTYSAKPYQPLLDALDAAVARGVSVRIVVETLAAAGSALAGPEPAAAFASVRGIELWHWPTDQRREAGAKMHAKIAVADRRIMLVSSANLTQSGVGRNIEAGLLVRGGSAPERAAEHIHHLCAKGILTRLHLGT